MVKDPYFEIKALLLKQHKSKFTVHFFKADGSARIMECELAGEHVPDIIGTGGHKQAARDASSPHLWTVWDTEANHFKSINLQSTYEIHLESGAIYDVQDLHVIERVAL